MSLMQLVAHGTSDYRLWENGILDEDSEKIRKNKQSYLILKNYTNCDDCSICLEVLKKELETNTEIVSLHCNHIFHKICIDKMIDKMIHNCPLCRKKLSEKNDCFEIIKKIMQK